METPIFGPPLRAGATRGIICSFPRRAQRADAFMGPHTMLAGKLFCFWGFLYPQGPLTRYDLYINL